MKKLLFPILSFFIILSFVTFSGCSRFPAEPVEKTEQLLGTIITLKVYDKASNGALEDAFLRAHEIENHMSSKLDASEINLVNQMAGIKSVVVSPDTFFVVSEALRYAELTNGGFDPAIGSLINLWGIGTDHAKLPNLVELSPYLNRSLYQSISLNPTTHEIFLTTKDAQLDLGAIAKGYVGDEMKRILQEHHITSALLNLGGNVLSIGSKPDKKNWVVGLQDPFDATRGTYIGKIIAPDQSIVTSGNYERYFIKDGIRYHHILNPKTGFPADQDIVSATIIAPRSIDADALSTSSYILGKNQGMALIETLPGIEAIFVTKSKEILVSSGITDTLFTLTNKEYTYEKR